MCLLPGCLIPLFSITLFCNFLGGIQDILNLPLELGRKETFVSLTPLSH